MQRPQKPEEGIRPRRTGVTGFCELGAELRSSAETVHTLLLSPLSSSFARLFVWMLWFRTRILPHPLSHLLIPHRFFFFFIFLDATLQT